MIITVTPNPAWDVTYTLPDVRSSDVHQIDRVSEQAGGKGVNVASVLTSMGRESLVVAPVGGPVGEQFSADLQRRGIPTDLVGSPESTRRSTAVVDHIRTTVLNERGPEQPSSVWTELVTVVRRHLPETDALVVSGSLPPGAPDDLLPTLVEVSHGHHRPVILDARGPALARALTSAPDLVKPNAAEATETTGERDPVAAARAMVRAGARAAVVSRGAAGLVLITEDGLALTAYLNRTLSGNPTGAGDALTAALAAAMADASRSGRSLTREDWWEALRHGVSWSAAAVLAPLAGMVDVQTIADVVADVVIKELT